MIKDQRMLASAISRLNVLYEEQRSLVEEFEDAELSAYMIPVRNEIFKISHQIEEYKLLRDGDIFSAVDYLNKVPLKLARVGQLLAKLRIAQGLSQSELANKLGWKQPNVSRFENENYSSQTVKNIVEYSGALGVNLLVLPEIPLTNTEMFSFTEIRRNPTIDADLDSSLKRDEDVEELRMALGLSIDNTAGIGKATMFELSNEASISLVSG